MAQKKTLLVSVVAAILIALAFNILTLQVHIDKKIADAYSRCAETRLSNYATGKCLRNLATTLYTRYAIANIEDGLTLAVSGQGSQWCHEFMHYVGWELYTDKKDLSRAFEKASGMCDSGMYHGVAEQYVNEKSIMGDVEEALRGMNSEACENEELQNVVRGMRGNCYHGLGHGFMFITSNNLPTALRYCDRIETGMKESCYTGAFMENNQSKQVGRNGSHTSEFFKPEEPNFPCVVLEEQHKDICYFYKGSFYLNQTRGEVVKAIEKCIQGVFIYQESCFRGIGANIPGHSQSSQESGELCNKALSADERAYEPCILGALSFIIQKSHGKAEDAVEFCEVIENSHKDICYRKVGNNLTDWVTLSLTIESKCAAFKDKHAKTLCLNPNN